MNRPVLALLALTALVAGACGEQKSATPKAAAPAAAKPVAAPAAPAAPAPEAEVAYSSVG